MRLQRYSSKELMCSVVKADEAEVLIENREWAIRELSAKIKQLEEEMEWISVKEKLPEDNERVLIFENRYNNQYTALYYKERNWFIVKDYMPAEDVSHWMPLPKPPKED